MSTINMNEQQQLAIDCIEGPLLILAGAGSGKTRVLTHRVANMIDMGINPYNILAITFTNKAAGEMRERIDDIVDFGAESVWVATFHATCVRILRRHIDRLGFESNFTIYDTADQKSVMKEISKRLQIDSKQLSDKKLLNFISKAKDELISPAQYEMNVLGDYNKKKISSVYREYQNVLKKNNALDFDDIIVKTVELFKANPDILEKYQDRFLYIMVDEYQDTNKAQFELIKLLADKRRNLCVVGDDDQSIYKFRGADIRNILDFEKIYPNATIIKLEQNYRSTQTILDAANSVIANNYNRKSKSLWTSKGNGKKIHFKQLDSEYTEAEYIVNHIISKHDVENLRFNDFAVLFRTNAQARAVEERCVKKGIPYEVVGGINFYSRKEIKDILAYLKVINNGQDDMAVKRIINVPKRGIGNTTILRIQEYAIENNISFYSALCEAHKISTIGRTAIKIEPFVTMIQAYRSKAEILGLRELVENILDNTGYLKEVEDLDDKEEREERIEHIDEFINKVADFEMKEDEPTLGQLLEEIALVADIDKLNDDDNKVLLMTLHSSKGLEFPYVYIAGMEDGVFPSYMTITSEDSTEIEEERRLAYVGITRAQDFLTITCARQRMIKGETQRNKVSRFVTEIPLDLLDMKLPQTKLRDFESYGNNNYASSGVSTSRFNSQTSFARPKATFKSNIEAKPFIAQSSSVIEGVLKGSDFISKPLDYEVGDDVRHIKYGIGKVICIEKGARDYEVTVDFQMVGNKIMLAAFAKLEKI